MILFFRLEDVAQLQHTCQHNLILKHLQTKIPFQKPPENESVAPENETVYPIKFIHESQITLFFAHL